MPLQPEHQRQIGQFMFIAEYYLRFAQPAERETTETLGMTKDDFLPGVPLTANTCRLTPIGAHLSSAAIRLASIEEVLKDANVQNDSYRQCRDYFNGHGEDADDPRGSTPSEWLHVMLRDNAAHEEPPVAPTSKVGRRRRARQDCLEAMTFSVAFLQIQYIARALRSDLIGKHAMAFMF
jgi:hypothetical protein